MTKRTDPADEQRILDLWSSKNWSAHYIGERLRIASSTVYRVLERHGIERPIEDGRQRKRHTTPEQDEVMVRRYLAGEGAQTIADDSGLKFHISVLQRVKAAGHTPRQPGGRFKSIPPDVQTKIIEMRIAGTTIERIARAVGIHSTKVGHLLRANGYGKTLSTHPNHRGNRVHTSGGYFAVRTLPGDSLYVMADTNGYVREHRYVMAQALGRPLTRGETVHHVNGDKADNRLENLQLRQGNHGKGARFTCMDCGSHNVSASLL